VLQFSLASSDRWSDQKSVLEDMLRACALHYGRSWDNSLPYAGLSYNIGYQESLKMAPFEMLYGHRC
jgi:hypothetical protein